ncbi:MAG: drug/metabolite transporter (DMT)-like permease [Bacillariaceae sp.]|jgi:drug/metabolite transporter (DMT)-like permease
MRRRIDLATRVATRVVATRVVATSVQALLMLLLLLHPFTNKTTIKITTTEAFIVNNNNRINNYNGNNNNNNNNKSIIIASSLLNVQRYFGGRRITNNNIRHDDDNNNNNNRLTSTSSRRELKLNLSNDQDSSNSNKINNNKNSYNKGLFVLMSVPVAWGTFEPAVRFVYKYQPLMPPLVFSFAYYLVASSVLTICSFLLMLSSSSSSSSSSSIIKTTNNDNDNTNTTISTATTAVAAAPPATTKINTSAMLTTLNDNTTTNNHWTKLPLSIQGGIELGTYLFIGNSFQVIGLKTVPSDRAAFLLQLTTIFVPILKSITTTMSSTTTSTTTTTTSTSLNKTFLTAVSLETWIACFVALAGVALIGLDNNNDGSNIINNDVQLLHVPLFSIDDGYIVLGAIFYTFHCIRLETYAKSSSSSPIQLATAKAVTETIWSGFVVGCCIIIALLFDGSSDSNMNHHNSMALLSLLPTFIVDTARTSGDNILSYVNDNNNDLLQQISLSFSSSSINHLETTAIVNNNGGGEGGGWYTVGLATLWTGSVTVAYTIFAQSFGQAIVPAVTANLIYTTQPFFTAIVAYLLLGERLGTHGYIGGILIGVAVLFVVTTTEEE